jgi:hypothetical protein
VHLDCGGITHGAVRCENCDGDLNPRNTRVEPPLPIAEERRVLSALE